MLSTPIRLRIISAVCEREKNVSELLAEIVKIPGDFWVRLLYTHPAHWSDELIRTIAECDKVAKYVDIPLQHISDRMLTAMKRKTQGTYDYLVPHLRTFDRPPEPTPAVEAERRGHHDPEEPPHEVRGGQPLEAEAQAVVDELKQLKAKTPPVKLHNSPEEPPRQ